ncbi:MAG: Ig-like domain-containing protein [Blautia sp.]|nr:Ig-like domain-containing protein [Blautia sp.]
MKRGLKSFMMVLSMIWLMLSAGVMAFADYPTIGNTNAVGSGGIRTEAMVATANGFCRVVCKNGVIYAEDYDKACQLIRKKPIAMELPVYGGFFAGKNAYFIAEGQYNTEEDDNKEVIRVIKYDFNWNRLGAASISSGESYFAKVRYPFDAGCCEMEETGGMLYLVTGHEGYVDEEVGQGHQGFLGIRINESTMKGEIVDYDLWHSFAQYIKAKDEDHIFVAELSEGSRCAELSMGDKDSLRRNVINILPYGGTRTSAWAIPTFATVDGIELSANNVITVGTSIDQSRYDAIYNGEAARAYNLYITVTPIQNFTETATKVIWLTNYTQTKDFTGVRITKINDNRFVIYWEEEYNSSDDELPDPEDQLSDHTLHCQYIDGEGNKIGKEYIRRTAISGSNAVSSGDKVIYTASSNNRVGFYNIDDNENDFKQKSYNVIGNNLTWNIKNGVLTVSGTGPMYPIDPEVTNSGGDYIATYNSASAWRRYSDKIQEIVVEKGVTTISDHAFYNLANVRKVTIADTVKEIGDDAFGRIRALTECIVPASVTKMGKDIFKTGYYWVPDGTPVINVHLCAEKGSYAENYAKENDIPLHYEEEIKEVKATCTKEGSKGGVKCPVCQAIIKQPTTTPKTDDHTYSSWKTTKQATVLATGKKSRTCSVCEKVDTKNIAKLSPKLSLNVGSTVTMKKGKSATVITSGMAKGDAVKKWTSSNKSVVAVSSKGKLTAKKLGTAKITVTLASGYKKSFKVTVKNSEVATQKVYLAEKEQKFILTKGTKYVLTPVITPATSTQKVTYSTSNKLVVSVNSKGELSAKKKGKAVITVKSGKKSSKLTVYVVTK